MTDATYRYPVRLEHIFISPGHNYFGKPKDGPGSYPTRDSPSRLRVRLHDGNRLSCARASLLHRPLPRACVRGVHKRHKMWITLRAWRGIAVTNVDNLGCLWIRCPTLA